MNSTVRKNQQLSVDSAKRVKKPYVKPEVRHERVFETRALTCGKTAGVSGACTQNKKTS